jgi:hypothetical protein
LHSSIREFVEGKIPSLCLINVAAQTQLLTAPRSVTTDSAVNPAIIGDEIQCSRILDPSQMGPMKESNKLERASGIKPASTHRSVGTGICWAALSVLCRSSDV